jgi:hypothetical protein
MLALHREYLQLMALSPAEAMGWQQRREAEAAARVQAAWRRRCFRQSILEGVQRSHLHRRAKAATIIQRAQRTRQRVVAEAGPPIGLEELKVLQKEVVGRSLEMAKELRAARTARAAWRASGTTTTASASAADEPPLPSWLETPEWEAALEHQRPGGSSVVHALRDAARRGLRGGHTELVASVRQWPKLRAEMQSDAVRRQVGRTQAAALHAQLRYPRPLPSAPPPSERGGAELTVPPVMPSKPQVLAAHRRLLREARLKLELEDDLEARREEADAAATSAKGGDGEGGEVPATPRAQHATADGSAVAGGGPPPPSPATAAALERLVASGTVPSGVSSAELIFLASLQPVKAA